MRLEDIYETYRRDMHFHVVYIQEAHPSDGWQIGANTHEGAVYSQPTTMGERVGIANTCMLRLDLSIPTLVDEMTNEVDLAYAALPDRLYLVDSDGRIAYRGDRGPMGFRPDEFEEAIRNLLDTMRG